MTSRLDQAIVSRGLVRSRNQGREFIRSGLVSVNGVVCRKPSTGVRDDCVLILDERASLHRVGRGYDKLRGFLAKHPLDWHGCFVVDGGASTGGFTQVALEEGAREVLAVELGREQLASELRENPLVRSRESTDIRKLLDPGADCDILMLDLSFISLREVLPELCLPFADGARLLALVKPQFELPPACLSRSGRVRRTADSERALKNLRACLVDCGWQELACEVVEPGPDQINREYLLLARRTEAEA